MIDAKELPQTKPLSDDEILELWVKNNKLNGADGIIDFARAIEKVHNIV